MMQALLYANKYVVMARQNLTHVMIVTQITEMGVRVRVQSRKTGYAKIRILQRVTSLVIYLSKS